MIDVLTRHTNKQFKFIPNNMLEINKLLFTCKHITIINENIAEINKFVIKRTLKGS